MIPSEVGKSIFHIYILGRGVHVVSIILAAIVIIIAYSIQKTHPRIIRLMNAFVVCVLGHYIYEDIFILIMGSVGRSTSGWPLYVLITVGIISFMSIVNSSYRSYEFNFNVILLYSLLFVIFFGMYYIEWFHELQLWYSGVGRDPHNWLWALSKGIGLAALLPVLRRGVVEGELEK